MALVKCKECGKEVSNKADVCVGCGYPIKIKQHTFNIEHTKKNLKLQLLISKYTMLLFAIVALFIHMMITKAVLEETVYAYVIYALIAMTMSMSWYVLTKIRTWWNHA